jgi:hypothetical protein
MLQTATDATTNARRWSMIPDHAQNPTSNLQKAQKRPEMAGSKLSEGFSKRGEGFQQLSPKSDWLPFHHSL